MDPSMVLSVWGTGFGPCRVCGALALGPCGSGLCVCGAPVRSPCGCSSAQCECVGRHILTPAAELKQQCTQVWLRNTDFGFPGIMGPFTCQSRPSWSRDL